MELLNNFGFEPILFIAQIVNFLIIFFVLKKFLYKPMLKMLDDRKAKISQGAMQAEEAARILSETTQKEESILKKAQEQAVLMIKESKAEQQELMRQSEKDTQTRVEKMLSDARDQIRLESALAEKRLTTQVSRIAIDFLKHSIIGLFGPNDQELIMKNALNKLKKKAD
jgi:F-type H+-transporting ATPase subunit b